MGGRDSELPEPKASQEQSWPLGVAKGSVKTGKHENVVREDWKAWVGQEYRTVHGPSLDLCCARGVGALGADQAQFPHHAGWVVHVQDAHPASGAVAVRETSHYFTAWCGAVTTLPCCHASSVSRLAARGVGGG